MAEDYSLLAQAVPQPQTTNAWGDTYGDNLLNRDHTQYQWSKPDVETAAAANPNAVAQGRAGNADVYGDSSSDGRNTSGGNDVLTGGTGDDILSGNQQYSNPGWNDPFNPDSWSNNTSWKSDPEGYHVGVDNSGFDTINPGQVGAYVDGVYQAGALPSSIQEAIDALTTKTGGLLDFDMSDLTSPFGSDKEDAVDKEDGLLGGLFSFDDTTDMTDAQKNAQSWDVAQKGLGILGSGVASSLTPFGMIAGQIARSKANAAYPNQTPIGLLEDLTRWDMFFGSPEDNLAQRQKMTNMMSVLDRGGTLSPSQRSELADTYNNHPDWSGVSRDDITSYGTIAGSEQSNMLEEQDDWGGDNDNDTGPSDGGGGWGMGGGDGSEI